MTEARGHLVLVGMMAVGKTTVGRAVAEALGRPFVDSDELVEARTGRTVREIFEAEGEAAYRVLETAALVDALALPDPQVTAAAGGVVLAAANREALRAPGVTVVWLRADPMVLERRIDASGGPGHRPLLDGDAGAALRRLAMQREPLYREVADAVIDVDPLSPDAVVQRVLAVVNGYGQAMTDAPDPTDPTENAEEDKGLLQRGVQAAADLAKSQIEATRDVVNTATEATRDVMQTSAEATRDVVSTQADAARSAVPDAADATREAGQATADAAADTASSASDAAASAARSGADATREAVGETERGTGASER